jgi:hypothetical protein
MDKSRNGTFPKNTHLINPVICFGGRHIPETESFERFHTFLEATSLDETGKEKKAKATFLLLIEEEAEQVYKTKRKTGDDLKTIEEILTAQFVTKKSEYTEVVAFRNNGEPVNDYAMRLRVLSTL